MSSRMVLSCSSRTLVHDVSQAKQTCFSTATSGGTGLQPSLTLPTTSHLHGSKLNAVAWSHNNQIIATGAEDGQIVLSSSSSGKKVHTIQANVNTIISGGAQYVTGNASVNTLAFSKNSEFICAGLEDGVGKIWNLQSKSLAANLTQPSTGKYANDYQFSPISSITLNSNNHCLATSNRRGVINLYKTDTVFDPIDGRHRSDQVQNISEYAQIHADNNSYSGSINQVQFSHLIKETLGCVTDHGSVCIYNINTKQMISQFQKHSGYVKGLSFSQINKLLMCSVGLDRQIIFYDINDKTIVKKIMAPFPIQSVSFSADGHTLAVGSSMNGQNQQCLIYDLRKSSSITLALQGHDAAVSCIRFANKYDMQEHKAHIGANIKKTTDVKTIDEIREQARQNIAKKLEEQKRHAKISGNNMTDQEMENEEFQIPQSSARGGRVQGNTGESKQEKQKFKHQFSLNTGALANFDDNLEIEVDIDDNKVDKEVVKAYIDQQLVKKLDGLQLDINEMIDNFQVDLVRQFQVQRGAVDDVLIQYGKETQQKSTKDTE